MQIKVYGVHITQENSLESLMNDEFLELTKSCGAAFVSNSKDPVRYLASFILPTKNKQEVFIKKLSEQGIKAKTDSEPVRVDKAYLEMYLGANWASEH